MISNLIHMELAHINTSHPDFIGGSRAVQQLLEEMGEGPAIEALEDDESEDDESDSEDATSPDEDDLGDNNAFAGYLAKSKKGGKRGRKSKSRATGRGDGAPTAARADRRAMMAGTHSSLLSTSGGAGAGRIVGGERVPSFSPGASPGLAMPSSLVGATAMTTRERMEVSVIKLLLQSYFEIVKKNFSDMVPKTIMCFLVNYTKENLQSELVRALYRDETRYDELLKEADDTASRRRACAEMQALLARALEIVHEVREFAVK